MSTNIHHGYRVALDGSAGGVLGFADRVRGALAPHYRDLYVRRAVELAALIVDAARFDRDASEAVWPRGARRLSPRRPIVEALHALDAWHQNVRSTGVRAPGNDLECEISFFSDPGDPDGPLYALVQSEESNAYEQPWAELPEIFPFPYWNSTDRPKGVTAAAWAERAAIWGRVIGGPFDVRGLRWTLLGEMHDQRIGAEVASADAGDLLAPFIPDVEKRAKQLVHLLPSKAVSFSEMLDDARRRTEELAEKLPQLRVEELQGAVVEVADA